LICVKSEDKEEGKREQKITKEKEKIIKKLCIFRLLLKKKKH
jgi:hypothetical protein